MSLLKTINDKGAVLEWSPMSNRSNMVAIGTKVIIIHYYYQLLSLSINLLGFWWYWFR